MNVKEIRRKNLRALARSVGGVTQLAERLGKSQSQISHLIGSNPVKNLGDKLATEIEQAFNKPNGWLDHEHPTIQEDSQSYQAPMHRRVPFYQVPLINWADLPTWLDPNHLAPRNFTPYIITHIPLSIQAFALRIEGDSMEAPTGISFTNGAIILVDPQQAPVNGSYVLAQQTVNSQIIFKQFIIDGNRRYLKPLNPRYPLVEIFPHAVICGVIRLMLVEFKAN